MSFSVPVCLLLVMTAVASPGRPPHVQSPAAGSAPQVPATTGEREDDDLTVPVMPAP